MKQSVPYAKEPSSRKVSITKIDSATEPLFLLLRAQTSVKSWVFFSRLSPISLVTSRSFQILFRAAAFRTNELVLKYGQFCNLVKKVVFVLSDTRRASHVVVFFCKHVYHEDCLPARDVVSYEFLYASKFIVMFGIFLEIAWRVKCSLVLT